MPTIRIVGGGRAGRSLAGALSQVGWRVQTLLGRDDDVTHAACGVDALVIATPDDVIATVAGRVQPDDRTVLVHLAGAVGPDVLAPHHRRAALHPLVALPDPETGARRLLEGVTFAVAGDPFARSIADALGGSAVEVQDEARPAYHAAACIAANHVVALLGQVQRVARAAGMTLDAFLPLAAAAVQDAGRLGPARALTGPAARGDWETVARHLDAIDERERAAYLAGVELALALGADSGALAASATPARAL